MIRPILFGFDPASPFAVGRHTVQLVVTAQAGLRSLPDAVEVVVTDDTAPTAVIDAPAQVNCGSDIPVSGEGSFDVGGRIVQYEWRLDDGAPVVTDVPSYTYPPNPCTPSLLGPHTVQLVVTDDTGNVSSPVFAEVVVGDGTPPSIELTTPGEAAVNLLNQAVAARFTCDDMESGIASCAGTLANGEAVDTSMVGTKTFTVSS